MRHSNSKCVGWRQKCIKHKTRQKNSGNMSAAVEKKQNKFSSIELCCCWCCLIIYAYVLLRYVAQRKDPAADRGCLASSSQQDAPNKLRVRLLQMFTKWWADIIQECYDIYICQYNNKAFLYIFFFSFSRKEKMENHQKWHVHLRRALTVSIYTFFIYLFILWTEKGTAFQVSPDDWLADWSVSPF